MVEGRGAETGRGRGTHPEVAGGSSGEPQGYSLCRGRGTRTTAGQTLESGLRPAGAEVSFTFQVQGQPLKSRECTEPREGL